MWVNSDMSSVMCLRHNDQVSFGCGYSCVGTHARVLMHGYLCMGIDVRVYVCV